jgi:chromosome partitioning protein
MVVCLAVNSGYLHMLDWIKRFASPAREQLVENEKQIERLTGRLGAYNRTADELAGGFAPASSEQSVENQTQTLSPDQKHSTEEKVERLFDRLATPKGKPNALAGTLSQTYVIAVACQKGGSGKTTIAAHLAVLANAAGQGPVSLVDTDPQGSLAEWWDARHDDSLALTKVKLDDLVANPAQLRSSTAAIAIIDTPPALTASIEQVIAIADLVLIPARPSPHDLRAIGATVKMVRMAGKPFLFVVNGAAPRANITAEAVAALSEHGRVAPVILYQRTDYAASMIDGRTVMETTPSGRSAQEIAELWKYVHAQISIRAAA